jgi:FSR family fosmidomycin resistance protein-like MFS transporter
LLRFFKNVSYPVWLITSAHAIADLSTGALFIALPFFKAKFGLSYAELTAIVLIQNFASSVSQPIFGYLSDQKSRPWWLPLGCFTVGTMLLASLLVPAYPLVLLCTGLSGLGSAIFHPEAARIVNLLSGKAKGKGASLFSVGGNVGFALGSMYLGALLGNPDLLYWFAVPNVIGGVLLLLAGQRFIRLPPAKSGDARKAGPSVRMNLPLLALLGMVLLRATVNSGINTFVPLYCTSILHSGSAYAASLLTVYLAAGAVGTLLGGPLSDRYGSKKVMLYSILPVAPLLYLFKSVTGAGAFMLLALVSVLLAATFTSSLVMAQKMMPGNVAMASGLTLGFSIGLGALGVLVLGSFADAVGLTRVFNLLAILPLIGYILTLFVQEPEDVAEKRTALGS